MHQCLQLTRLARGSVLKVQQYNFSLQESFAKILFFCPSGWINFDVCTWGLCDSCRLLLFMCNSQHLGQHRDGSLNYTYLFTFLACFLIVRLCVKTCVCRSTYVEVRGTLLCWFSLSFRRASRRSEIKLSLSDLVASVFTGWTISLGLSS